ncbi:MAG: hypothetical protein ACJ8E4_10455 [Sphingomicrobium sp.]
MEDIRQCEQKTTRLQAPRQKAILLALAAAIALTSAIDWAGWQAFGGHERLVAGMTWLAAILYVITLLAITERR